MDDTYDIVVVGGGPVGEVTAQYAIQGSDLTAAIVESDLMGGECSYYACMPSKALLRPLDVAEASAHIQGLSPAGIDPAQLLARRDEWVSHYDDSGQVRWAQGEGIEVIRGSGRLAGEGVVSVGERRLTARHAVVVTTGSTPEIPEYLAGLHPWTSRDATGVVEVPARLVIVGGGPVACEAARWLAALGSQVTLLARSGLLSRFEPFCGEQVADGLRAAGIEVRVHQSPDSAERPGARDTGLGRVHGGPVRLRAGDDTLEADEVLVATGRRPNLAGLQADPQPDWLHYVGDVSGDTQLTHWGKYRARLLGEQIQARALGKPLPAVPDDVPVPQVVFTAPQVAATGHTLEQAQKRWPGARAIDVPYSSAAGAGLLRDDLTGTARLVVSPDDVVRGATFTGPEVAEIVHGATIAIAGGLTLERLWHAVPSYPTASEVWLRLLEAARQTG